MKVQIYNLTDSEVTIWECIQNDQFCVGNCGYADEKGFREFGVPYNDGDSVDNREALTELMEVLGKPSMVADCNNGALSYVDREEDEEFAETVSLGGEKVGRTDKDRRTGKEREPIDKAYYICQTYNRLGKNACTSHKIEARDLYNLVLTDIQEVAAMALKDKEAFYGRLSQRMEKQYLADTDSLKREYESLAQRNQEIDDTFISLYADKAKGILTEKRFLKLTDAMEKEQESNQKRMLEIAALISEEEHSEGDLQMFMEEIKRYAAITELDETVLNRLINRILIGESKKVDGVKTQEVRIVYNFVGEL